MYCRPEPADMPKSASVIALRIATKISSFECLSQEAYLNEYQQFKEYMRYNDGAFSSLDAATKPIK